MGGGHELHGYFQLPEKPEQTGKIWLTFNAQIHPSAEGARHEGFSLRLTAEWPRVSEGPPEIGVQLTTEQWLDLIADMRRELRDSEEFRKQADNWRSPKIELYISRTAEFSRTAREAYARMLHIRKQIPSPEEISWPESNSEAARSLMKSLSDLDQQAEREAFVVVVFAAFALESLINAWAVRDLSPRWGDLLDKLSLVAKWVVVPRLAADVEIDSAGQLFEKLRTLVRERNKIAHPKTEILKSVEQLLKWAETVPDRDHLKAADNAIAALNEAVEFARDTLGPNAAGSLLGQLPAPE
jgi:hypothetical protein